MFGGKSMGDGGGGMGGFQDDLFITLSTEKGSAKNQPLPPLYMSIEYGSALQGNPKMARIY